MSFPGSTAITDVAALESMRQQRDECAEALRALLAALRRDEGRVWPGDPAVVLAKAALAKIQVPG